jgi:20S proteasome subunit alpha 3
VRRVCPPTRISRKIANFLIVEFATVGKTKDGRIYHHLWGADEITTLLKEHDLARDETGADGDRIVS